MDVDAHQPDVVFRAFKPSAHVVHAGVGLRLASAWFKSKEPGVSVYLGSGITAREVAARHADCGVAAVRLDLLHGLGVDVEIDPADGPTDHPAHRICKVASKSAATRIAFEASIVVALRGFQVVGQHDQSVGVEIGTSEDQQ